MAVTWTLSCWGSRHSVARVLLGPGPTATVRLPRPRARWRAARAEGVRCLGDGEVAGDEPLAEAAECAVGISVACRRGYRAPDAMSAHHRPADLARCACGEQRILFKSGRDRLEVAASAAAVAAAASASASGSDLQLDSAESSSQLVALAQQLQQRQLRRRWAELAHLAACCASSMNSAVQPRSSTIGAVIWSWMFCGLMKTPGSPANSFRAAEAALAAENGDMVVAGAARAKWALATSVSLMVVMLIFGSWILPSS